MQKNYNKLEKQMEKISHLSNILSLIHWDIACNIKKDSLASRTQEIITIEKIIYSKLNSIETKNLLKKAKQEILSLDIWQKTNLKEIERKIINATLIKPELQEKLTIATTHAEINWRQAKEENNYNIFKPYLQKVLDYTKEISKIRSKKFNLSLYDSLLDSFDLGSTSKENKEIFEILKKELPPLIEKTLSKQKNMVFQEISINLENQKKLNKYIIEIIGFNIKKGRLDESIHPFCGGTPYDIRMTTHYNEKNFLDSLYGAIHETGHALYEQNLPEKYKNQPVGQSRGFQFHESESLLMEKQIGKSKPFIIFLHKILKNKFQQQNSILEIETLHQQVNQVKPNCIRIYSDELTYILHIILRFEIEELLINDQLSLDDLPDYWNQKYKEYLKITPRNFSEGCLQDIHWSQGSFGYFPSYAKGMIIAAMKMKKIKQLYPEIQNNIQQGDFKQLNNYLNNNFRNFGSLKKPKELLYIATGEEKINPYIFIDYLKEKFLL
ncbi:carboxypeptidase M32 [Candidatus Phytoplasma pini]|uniref:Metal-dependent carboxypeptidase n=1 Tax=Candidatus Phytoplasma pini TaxID=267362 RepID=A0A559KJ57_9MOLU|nr:carboxypeptidase M32 [Candidatus Phytoplasma pini]TVY12137.1 Zn-dependent carboxypeptidase [Candidatus Phytoplasma pini]